MVTPPQIVALEQIQLPLPMWIGFAYSRSWKPSGYCCGRRSSGRNGWNHFFQQTLLSFFHPQRCAVEFISGFHPKRMVFFQIFAVGIVESAGFHSFPVIHVCFSFFLIASSILLSPEMSAHFLL
jgi:hypothetical protein